MELEMNRHAHLYTQLYIEKLICILQKQTTRTEFVPSKPVATPMPPAPAPVPPAPAPARVPTPPLPPPAAEPTKLAASSSTVSRQNSNASSDMGSVAMREQNSQKPAVAAGSRKSRNTC